MSNRSLVLVLFFLGLFGLISCSHKFHDYDDQSKFESSRKQTRLSNTINERPYEPGKCYAKCRLPVSYTYSEEQYAVYTGSDFDNENIKLVRKKIFEGATRWEKRLADRNCLSKNPEDCMVWCLIEEPARYKSFYEVRDTNLVKDFVFESIEIKKSRKSNDVFEWREVVCDNDLKPALFRTLQEALADRGFNIGPHGPTGEYNSSTQKSLVKFQVENELPIGQLDMETLAELGIMDY